jgi:hypothetical protein
VIEVEKLTALDIEIVLKVALRTINHEVEKIRPITVNPALNGTSV